MKVLFLCSGNVHRSPLGEAILKTAALRDGRTDLEVASAGTMDLAGSPAVDEVVSLAGEAGLDLTRHRARAADAKELSSADLVVAMETYHLRWIADRHPEASEKCRLLSEYAGHDAGIAPGEDVPDAIGEDLDSFRRSFGIIQACVARLYRQLPPPPEEVYTRAIEDRFRLRRGSPLTLSPADYELVDRWWTGGVPLWIILETIDTLVGRKKGAGDAGRVRRLSYVETEVERRFESFQRGRVAAAAAPAMPAQDREDPLRIAAERFSAAAQRARGRGFLEIAALLEKAARDLRSDAGEPSLGDAPARLRIHAVVETLLEALAAGIDPAERAALRAEAEESLGAHRGRMTPAAFESTVARLMERRLREIHDLPDLDDL